MKPKTLIKEGVGETSEQSIEFDLTIYDMEEGCEKRYVDRAIASMMQDAMHGETEPVQMINKRLFRQNESTPLVDEIRLNKSFVMRLMGSKI